LAKSFFGAGFGVDSLEKGKGKEREREEREKRDEREERRERRTRRTRERARGEPAEKSGALRSVTDE